MIRPQNLTARFIDFIDGNIVSLDRTVCATCHAAEYCSACHNELPRSHVPLPLFKAGAHAVPAMLDERACLTCHTFQNTCAECHLNKIVFNPKGISPHAAALAPEPPAFWKNAQAGGDWRNNLLLFR